MKEYQKPDIRFRKTEVFERVAANCFNYGGTLRFPYNGATPPNKVAPAEVNVSILNTGSGECTNEVEAAILAQIDQIWQNNQGKPENNSDAYIYNVIGPSIDVNTTDNDYVDLI